MDKGKPLLIVDVQQGFIKNGAGTIIDPIRSLLDSWNGLVYYLRYKNYPGSLYTQHLDWHEFMTSNQHDIVPDIYKSGCEIFDHFGYAPAAELIEKIKPHGEAYICGLDTDACVMAAVFACWDNEIRPYIIADCCACSDGESFHKAALDIMLRQFGVKSVIKSTLN